MLKNKIYQLKRAKKYNAACLLHLGLLPMKIFKF